MKNKNIFITREIPGDGIKLLKDKGYKVTVSKKKRPLTKAKLVTAMSKKKYVAMISLLNDHIDAEVFDVCPTLKVVANYTVGFNNIDVEEATKRGIRVTNTRGTSALAVAEHAVALMMAVSMRVVEGDRLVRKGKYKGWDPELLMGLDLHHKTIGIIGAGAIGQEVSHILHRGFACKILYTDIKRNEKIESGHNATFTSMENLLKESDIISIHVPLMKETHHLINSEKIHLMKKTAVLINTSRGAVIDEKALVHALQNNIIWGAGLDVFENEPEMTEGLAKLNNVVLTPHIASSRPSARNEMSELAAKNIISFIETGAVITPVN